MSLFPIVQHIAWYSRQ